MLSAPHLASAAPAPAEPVRETVYVTSTMDSDGDGRLDRIATHILRPATSGAGSKVSTIMQASPYFGETPRPSADGRRIPISENRTPGHFNGWFDDYFIPRGYASVEVDMSGTGLSEGCPTSGGPQDTAGPKAVIDWLNGRTTAFYADGTPAVASWSTGNVGMIGTSYDGTLPIAVAATGVVGLKTIVPIAAISSWYDYSRAQGIAFNYWNTNYSRWLAEYVANTRARSVCLSVWNQLDSNDADETGDYTSFWSARNYRDNVANFTASTWLVHGQKDDNVKTNHVGPLWSKLVELNKPRRLWLHDGEHYDPIYGDATMLPAMGRWMDYYINGVANGALSDPQVTIDRPGGVRNTYPSWPLTTSTNLFLGGPGTNAAGTLRTTAGPAGSQTFADGGIMNQANLVASPQVTATNRVAYLTGPLATSARLSGTGQVRLNFTSSSSSTPLTAVLVHYTGNDVTRIVTRGSIDAKNRTSLATGTPLTPGTAYTATINLEAKDYVFPAGSRIGLIVSANNPDYITNDPASRNVTVSFTGSQFTFPGTFPPPTNCTNPPYSATAIYNTGNVVSHNNRNWRAKWWTQGQEPGTTGQWGVWEDLGAC